MSFISTRKLSTQTGKLTSRVSLGAALLSGLVAGQVYAEGEDTALSDVVINPDQVNQANYFKDQLGGTKFTQPVAKTPKTIQIMDKSLLADQHATTLTEALRNSPGVGTFYVGENGNSSTGDTIYMRGFDSSGSIFVDGVRDLGAISRDTFNTEQVEVIKGPSGADYGRTAPSGSVNMVSKQAWLENHADLSISRSTANQNRVTVDGNGQFSSTGAARLNLLWEDSDVPGRDHVANRRYGVAPAVAFGLGTDTRLKLNYLHINQDNMPDGGALTIGLPGWSSPDVNKPEFNAAPKPDSSHFYGTRSDYNDVQLNMATVIIEHDLAEGVTVHNTTRWGQTQQEYLLSAFMATATNANTWNMNDLSNWQMNHLVNALDQENRILTNQLGLVQALSTFGIKHNLAYGIEVTREEVQNTGVKSSPLTPTTMNIYYPDFNKSYSMVKTGADSEGVVDTRSLYVYDHIELTPQWQLATGLRFDHYDARYQADTACSGTATTGVCAGLPANTIVPSVDGKDSGKLFTYQLGLLYQLTKQGNLYLDYALATQPPGGNSLKMSASTGSADNAKFDPQQATTVELGTKWQLFDEKMLLSAAVYRTLVENQVEQDPTDNQYYQNGEKQIQGFEISSVGQITDSLNLSMGYTKLSSKVTEGKAKAKDGSKDLPYNPSSSFTSWLTYRLPVGVSLAGGARYNGELKRGTDGAVGTPTHTESYWVMDAMAGYQVSKNLAFQLNVYNLLDKDYVAAINKSGYRYTPGQPRTAMLNLNLTF